MKRRGSRIIVPNAWMDVAMDRCWESGAPGIVLK
jgi:hypothetical protein